MSPTSKNPPSRPPVRVKSALPAPRVAPKRVHVPWHRRTRVRVLGGIVIFFVLLIVALQGLSAWHRHQADRATKAAVKRYDDQLQAEFNPLSNILSEAHSSPQAYLGGSLPQAQFVTQTAQWLTTFQTLEHSLAASDAPAEMIKPRALFAQGVVVFIDAVKLYQLGATINDPALRKTLVQQGDNTLLHAEAVFANGVTEEGLVVNRYHLVLPSGVTPSSLSGPPSIPQETNTATQAPPAATPAPAVVPAPVTPAPSHP